MLLKLVGVTKIYVKKTVRFIYSVRV